MVAYGSVQKGDSRGEIRDLALKTPSAVFRGFLYTPAS